MKVDYEKLKEGLCRLTGKDYERAEREERQAGNDATVLITTSSFACRLAAAALQEHAPKLKELPMKEYLRVQTVVLNFFNEPSEEKTQDGSIEGSQSDAQSTQEQNTGSDKRRQS